MNSSIELDQLRPFRLIDCKEWKIESPLLKYAFNVNSQFGEDGILERMFAILQIPRGYCVEFGASDGRSLSNTYNLIQNHGWSGLLIEANIDLYRNLCETYQGNPNVKMLNCSVDIEGDRTIDSLLRMSKHQREVDLMSIDIDGMDYFIFESMSEFRPKVLVIEFNPSIPNDVVFIQAKNNKVHQGSSLAAMVELAKIKRYELVCATATNAIFVCAELYLLFGLETNHIDKLYRPPMNGRIFHGYDSTIFILGMPYLIWSGVQIEHSDIQVLPKSSRRYAGAQNS
jgi:hypothetical protein